MKNYYKILQLPLLSSIDEVRRSYKILALKYHPDKNNNQRFYVDYFSEINEAYKFLSSENFESRIIGYSKITLKSEEFRNQKKEIKQNIY